MFELFKAEFLRFRSLALALAGVHLVVLAFLTRVVDLAQQPLVVHWTIGGCHLAIGLLAGLYQMGTYRKASVWLTLLHRPMPPRRVAIAIMLASIAALAVVVAIPILLVALWQDTMSARVVDLRHWLLALSGLQLATIGYLAGAQGMLGGARRALATMPFLLLLPMASATGPGMLALQAVCVLCLMAIVLASFQPDLDAPPAHPLAEAIVAMPLQIGVSLLLVLAAFGAEFAWIAEGSHPNNTAVPPRGGHNEAEKADAATRMRLALEGSRHPDAALLREQIALSDTMGIPSQLRRLPLRHELANVAPMEFDDRAQGVRWVFSHDDMRFHGWRLNDRSAVGTLGVGDTQAPFPAPPVPVGPVPGGAEGDVVLFAGDTAYQYASDDRRIHARIRLPGGEQAVGAGMLGEALGVIGARALYVFDAREAMEHRELMTPRLRVPIPGAYRDIYNLDIIELVDGHLFVFSNTYGAYTQDGAAPVQYVLRAHDDGRIETLAARRLAYDYPAVFRYRTFVISPALHAVRDRALRLFAPPLPLETTTPPPVPRAMWWLAAVLSLLAGLGGWWRTRRLDLTPPRRWTWVAACALFGPPALGALWLMHRPADPVRQHDADAHHAH
jgi:hypothetical protein